MTQIQKAYTAHCDRADSNKMEVGTDRMTLSRRLTAEYHRAELDLRRVAQRCEGVHRDFFHDMADEVRARWNSLDGFGGSDDSKDSPAFQDPSVKALADRGFTRINRGTTDSTAARVMPGAAESTAAARDENAASTGTAGAHVAPPSASAVPRAFFRSEALHRMGDLIERVVDAYAAKGTQQNDVVRRSIFDARNLSNKWSERGDVLTRARERFEVAITKMTGKRPQRWEREVLVTR